MALAPEDKTRSLVPRWRSFANTVKFRELRRPTTENQEPSRAHDTLFEIKIREWQSNRTLSFARQLVGAAIVMGRRDEAIDAAKLILGSPDATSTAKHLARVILGQSTEIDVPPDVNHLVKRSREQTRTIPSCALPWIDLALGYTINGKLTAARRAIMTGVQLAGNDRFVLRCASRFFVHTEEFDTAHDILCRAESVQTDPWLLACEAAVANLSNRQPLFVKSARQLLKRRSHHESQLNELLGALGTLEFHSGNRKVARRLFNRALIDPSENVLAQARWATNSGLQIDIEPSLFELPTGYETRAWQNWYLSKWQLSVNNSREWLQYQQFQREPAVLGSFVAGVALEDHATAIKIIEGALPANPKDTVLLNNLAYSLASSGQLDRSEAVLRAICTSGDRVEEVYRFATTGLLRFRQGRVELGRLLYSKAREKALGTQDKDLPGRVMMFWALEEARQNTSVASSIRSKALVSTQADHNPIIDVLSERLRGIADSGTHTSSDTPT